MNQIEKSKYELYMRSWLVFILAAFLEILGGYLIWQHLKEKKSMVHLILGSIMLTLYGIVATLQADIPQASFGRVYAVYGGVFILGSYLWGHVLDGLQLDRGDVIGIIMALSGVVIAWYYPRK